MCKSQGHKKSLNIEKSIRQINKKKPKVINVFTMLGLGFLPAIASIVKNKRWPPSKTGIGNRFIIPIAVDKTATNQKKFSPPCLTICPDVSAILTGPDKFQLLILPNKI